MSFTDISWEKLCCWSANRLSSTLGIRKTSNSFCRKYSERILYRKSKRKKSKTIWFRCTSSVDGGDILLGRVVNSLDLGNDLSLHTGSLEGLLHMWPGDFELVVSDLQVSMDSLHVPSMVVVGSTESLSQFCILPWWGKPPGQPSPWGCRIPWSEGQAWGQRAQVRRTCRRPYGEQQHRQFYQG